ncbi:MAG: NAD(P)H-hydrate epimerase [Planctomycetaceae bacterium]|nr:NAD(P)H-hydrate epimerase [Planctomycetaceae bacterium]
MTSIPRALTREQVRDVDLRAVEEYGMTGLVLMENAGRGAADVLLRRGISGRVVVCCGKGNNGGDGFVIARHLEAAGVDVLVSLACQPEEISGDAAVNLAILQAARTPISLMKQGSEGASLLNGAEWIIDALLGTGISGKVREPYGSIIDAINRARGATLAVDLPSGLDCNLGEPLGMCIRADLTVTFVSRKIGFDQPDSLEWTGPVEVLPIGVPRQLLAAYNL